MSPAVAAAFVARSLALRAASMKVGPRNALPRGRPSGAAAPHELRDRTVRRKRNLAQRPLVAMVPTPTGLWQKSVRKSQCGLTCRANSEPNRSYA
jgi:hypothetical protein